MLARIATAAIFLATCGLCAPTSTVSTHSNGEPFATNLPEPSAPTATTHPEYAAERSPVLSVITIALICAVLCALLAGRLAYVRRYYDIGFRSFFIPPNGLNLICVRIRGPVATKRPDGPPTYRGPLGPNAQRERRHRRGRQVQGPDVDATGARRGDRDQDDVWDGEPTAGNDAEKDVLPGYSVDVDLPGYNNWSRRHSLQHVEDVEAAANILTDQQYEAATRQSTGAVQGGAEMQQTCQTLSVTGVQRDSVGERAENATATTRHTTSNDVGEQRLS
ncbi:hypothetical protein OIV83_003231 [Microbotryomycetes sp. JL201]|nr:hypothetical protein OIV83_003231 [Microbotryomycetes sp. JL201]